MYENGDFSQKITVPFCPESKLSGIEYKDFMNAVWYRRTFAVPDAWSGDGFSSISARWIIIVRSM